MRGIRHEGKVMKDSPTKAALKRAMSRLEQSPSSLGELKALEGTLKEVARSRTKEAAPETLLRAVRALALGGAGIGRGIWRMSSQTWVDLAVKFITARLYAPALLACEAAMYADADCAEAWFNKAVVLTRWRLHAQALAAYREARRLRPDHPEIPFNMGGILCRLGRHEEALAAYDEAIRCSGSPRLRPALGDGLLERAERRRPECAEAWFNKGVVLAMLGRFDEAAVAYKEALRLKPDFPKARANLKASRKGEQAVPLRVVSGRDIA